MIVKILLALFLLTSQAYREGEELFLKNKPQEARHLFEEALSENPENEKIYLYLGIVYEQLNDPEQAIKIMKRGLRVAKKYKDRLYYNMGNNFFKQDEFTLAEEMYSNALERNRQLDGAYLNRANSRLRLEKLIEARDDYIQYLELAPASPQREEIEKLIALLGQILADSELRKQDELRKQKALLNEVLNSLQNASEQTRNLSAGSEEIEEEYEEIDITD